MDDESTTTDKDAQRQYLQERPALELSMWTDWVQTVCRWRNVAPPTAREWDLLTKVWVPGKMPLTSVEELQALRTASALSGANPETPS